MLKQEALEIIEKRQRCLGVSFQATLLMHFWLIPEHVKPINTEEVRIQMNKNRNDYKRISVRISETIINNNAEFQRGRLPLVYYLSWRLEEYVLKHSNLEWGFCDQIPEDQYGVSPSTYYINPYIVAYIKERAIPKTSINFTSFVNMAVMLSDANKTFQLKDVPYYGDKYEDTPSDMSYVYLSIPLKQKLRKQSLNSNGVSERKIMEIHIENLLNRLGI